ncbi:hypothetical protein H696_01310 [Fonticula alba]|uniref:Amino acid transporter transmembrane domain-containing protein n=1 Tax=Fonticula alba TaxID=691883 RepID=A0A058ZD89_FONAL|nr:hypothetical protein H696_01310 [Fonticula alba]KCV71901.1 hypothetical protein H696_01310 [Fonticula alba]|eukprot:XP_009493479.1 hypothetical protein H696_01310 [Fonticula alba]
MTGSSPDAQPLLDPNSAPAVFSLYDDDADDYGSHQQAELSINHNSGSTDLDSEIAPSASSAFRRVQSASHVSSLGQPVPGADAALLPPGKDTGLSYDALSSDADSVQTRNRSATSPGHFDTMPVLSHLTTTFQTLMNITKSIVGAGSFMLPYCLKNMGIIGGSLTIILFGLVCTYSVLILVRCKRLVASRTFKRELTYVDLAREVFGPSLSVGVFLLLIFASLGVSASYIVFVGDTMHDAYPRFSSFDYKLVTTLIILPITWLRTLKALSYTSVVGTLCLVVGMVVTMVYGFDHHLDDLRTADPTLIRFDTYFHSFGSVAFLFCISFLVLPIERSMRYPRRFWLPLALSVAFVSLSNIVFAILGYLFFGEDICSNILHNLTIPSVLVDVIKVAICIDLIFTYPLIFSAGREIVENALLRPGVVHSLDYLKRCGIRTVLVALTFGLAQVKSFGLITNLVGVPMSLLAFVCPPMMHFMLVGWHGVRPFERWVYTLIVVGGLACAILTTVIEFIVVREDCGAMADALGGCISSLAAGAAA